MEQRTTARQTITDFLGQRTLAIVGVSRSGKKFGAAILRELKAKGYTMHVVHPEAEQLPTGDRCHRSLQALPEPVGGVVVVVSPPQTAAVVREAAAAKIPRLWMQQGAQSEEAVRLCGELGLSEVHGQCILMFAEPAMWIHRCHRWMRGLRSGGLPQ